jgi:hypothetical protein
MWTSAKYHLFIANDRKLHRNSFPLKSGIIAVQADVIRSAEPLWDLLRPPANIDPAEDQDSSPQTAL